jgi:hypothetical protein
LESASGGQLGGRLQDACHDHGDDQIAFGARGTGKDRFEAEAAESAEGSGDVAVGKGAVNLKGIGGGNEGLALEEAAKGIDLEGSPSGEIGEGAFDDFAVHAGGFAEEDGWGRIAVGYGFDVHGIMIHAADILHKHTNCIYMGTNNNEQKAYATN